MYTVHNGGILYSGKIWRAINLVKCPNLAFGEFYTWWIAHNCPWCSVLLTLPSMPYRLLLSSFSWHVMVQGLTAQLLEGLWVTFRWLLNWWSRKWQLRWWYWLTVGFLSSTSFCFHFFHCRGWCNWYLRVAWLPADVPRNSCLHKWPCRFAIVWAVLSVNFQKHWSTDNCSAL